MMASWSPEAEATTHASRCEATTRAGCQPAASNGRKAAAQPGSQPSSVSCVGAVTLAEAAAGWRASIVSPPA